MASLPRSAFNPAWPYINLGAGWLKVTAFSQFVQRNLLGLQVQLEPPYVHLINMSDHQLRHLCNGGPSLGSGLVLATGKSSSQKTGSPRCCVGDGKMLSKYQFLALGAPEACRFHEIHLSFAAELTMGCN